MNFKKATTVIWIVLAFLFIAVLFLHVYSESIYIDRHDYSDGTVYWKINKLTGRIYFLAPPKQNEWRRTDNLPNKKGND